VTITSPSTGQVLKYNGTAWVNGTDNNTGTVTSVAGTGTVSGITLSGTVTSTGNLTLGGTFSAPISSINDSTSSGQSVVKMANPASAGDYFLRLTRDGSSLFTTLFRTPAETRTDIGANNATNLTTGTVATARLGTGTANSTTFLRGDNTWVTPPGSGDVVGPASSVNARIATFNGTTGKLIQDSGTLISGLATSTHTHGNISNTGAISTATQIIGNGDNLLIRDASNSSLISNGPLFGTSTTTFLANNGTFLTPPYPVSSVNGLTGALNTEVLTTSNSTVNSVTYGRTLGQAIIDSVGTRMRISTGFFAPTGSSTSSSISFGTTFAAVPMVVVFILKASTTTTTAVVAKATAVTTTGATVTCSFVTPSTSGYTVSTETYGWIAIGY
jgi:hypothetical protein